MRTALLVAHTGRERSRSAALEVVEHLRSRGVAVRLLRDEVGGVGLADEARRAARRAGRTDLPPVTLVEPDAHAAQGCEVVVTVGGDGTLLRGAELARAPGALLLGVNLGRVGFLAEVEPEDLEGTVEALLSGRVQVEERRTVDVAVVAEDEECVARAWALNEVSLEKGVEDRMLDVLVEVEGRPLCRWGCDGVVCSTPTGSTAYAFSAGGPVVWPSVDAVLVVPVSAHALFARPLVVHPDTEVGLQVAQDGAPAVLWCDGRRRLAVPPGARVELCGDGPPVRLARASPDGFTDRLVRKFDLPVQGWRRRDPHLH